MADVIVDIDKVKEAISVYSNYRRELENNLNSLKSTINYLQLEWSGAAKNTFINDHFPKLCESMKEHIKKIELLEKELGSVSDDFSNLDREVSSRT